MVTAHVKHTPHPMGEKRTGAVLLGLISLFGVVAFIAPYLAAAQGPTQAGRIGESLLLTVVLAGACLAVLFANLGPALSAKSVALLGVLVGVNATLRLLDTAFLASGGEFSPVFLLVMLVGYVFGAQFGFLMGALTMLASAFITAGIGPWLPFQMFTAGWVGMTAAWLPGRNHHTTPSMTRLPGERREVLMLAAFGFGWGPLYGVIINFYDPLALANAEVWGAGGTVGDFAARYAVFYVVRSLPVDLVRAVGNAGLMLALGGVLLRVLRRFRSRFEYQVVQVEAIE